MDRPPCNRVRRGLQYIARVLCSFPKSNGKVRYVVEDHGRIFIQREPQIRYLDEQPEKFVDPNQHPEYPEDPLGR